MFAKDGIDNLIVMVLVGIALIAGGYFTPKNWISIILYILGGLLIVFALWFFRDPERIVAKEAVHDESVLVSPADGKVVQIIDVEDNEFTKAKLRQISIFLSPLDVHVNRSPISGVVKFYHYNQGDYLVAWHPKSSELNERSHIGVENSFGKILFKQITGYVARRIVCNVREGDTLKAGDKIGMMKFGSRMDVLVPLNTEIFVKEGDKVKAAETIIAKLKK